DTADDDARPGRRRTRGLRLVGYLRVDSRRGDAEHGRFDAGDRDRHALLREAGAVDREGGARSQDVRREVLDDERRRGGRRLGGAPAVLLAAAARGKERYEQDGADSSAAGRG